MLCRLLLSVILTLSASSLLPAQNFPRQHKQPGQQAMPMQPVELEGKIEGVMQGRITMFDKNNQPWQVAIPANAVVQVTGEASPDVLQNGLIVEFLGEINDQGKLSKPIEELTLVSLSPMKQMGLFPPEAAEGQNGPEAEELFGNKPEKKPAKRHGKQAIEAGTYRVIGRLIVQRGNKYSVNTGQGVLPFELVEEPKVALDFADYSVAGKGDGITVSGMAMGPTNMAQPNMVKMAQANIVKIELTEPLAAEKKKGPAAKADAKRPAKRPKKDGGLPEPAEER